MTAIVCARCSALLFRDAASTSRRQLFAGRSRSSSVRWNSTSAAKPDVGAEGAQEGKQTDLLQVYRGLVESRRLTWDDEQVRVVMRVRAASGD